MIDVIMLYRPTGPAEFMRACEMRTAETRSHTEWWIPAADVDALNDNIVGTIEVIHEFGQRPEIPAATD